MSSEPINNPSGARDGGEADLAPFAHLEPELAELARSLDARGSDIVGARGRLAGSPGQDPLSRGSLSSESLDRIFAASDMQLPLASAPVAGTIGRRATSGSALSFGRLLRIAAVVAAAAGMGVAVYVVTRSFEDSPNPLKNGTAAPQGAMAQAQPQPPRDPVAPALRASDLETALSGALAARTAVRPSTGSVLALSDEGRSTLARVGASRAAQSFGDDGFGDDGFGDDAHDEADGGMDDALAALDAAPTTFAELSGEFSALLAASGASR